ncbi:hypothetical protein FFT47_23715 [Klebsiella pneumoniae]|nr:hypothetical protein FFT47_23715 [Klebsiella pneumoniae]
MPAGAPELLASKFAKNPGKYCYFSRIKPCIHRVHGFAPFPRLVIPVFAPVPARPKEPQCTCMKTPTKRAGQGQESTARQR